MAITSLDQLAANLPGQHRHIYKASATAEGAGTWHSLFLLAGLPGAGSTPPASTAGSGYVPTTATAGALPFTNPPGGNAAFLAKFMATLTAAGTVILYDRLWHCSGFGTVVTTAQNVTTPGSLTRPDANGADVEIWGEVYTAPGATGATWTVSYTNQDGTAGRTATYTHPANAESVGQMFPFVLAAGDTGVRSVQSFTASVSSGTAGNIGITLLRRIAEIPVPLANTAPLTLDAFALGLPQIYNDACLCFMVQCSGTASGALQASVSIINDLVITAPANNSVIDVMHFQAETFDDSDLNQPITANAATDIDATTTIWTRKFLGASLTAALAKMLVPNATTAKFEFVYRAASAPGTTNNKVRWRIGERTLGTTGAESTFDFTDQTVPNNANFQVQSQTVSLASLGWSPGDMLSWQLQRVITGVTNNMTQDALLSELKITFFP